MFEGMSTEEIVNELMKLGTEQQKEIIEVWTRTLYIMLANLTARVFELTDGKG